jgi:hypothetical protein
MRSPLPFTPTFASSSGSWSGPQLVALMVVSLAAGLMTGRLIRARRRRAETQVFGHLPD